MTAHGHVVFPVDPAEVGTDGRPTPALALPRPVGAAMIALALGTIAIATFAALSGRKAPIAEPGAVQARRVIEVPTARAPGLDVREPGRPEVVARLEAGDAEFLRAVARALEGPAARRTPRTARLELAWHVTGQLMVRDLDTGRSLSVNAFGQDQVARLARVLVSRGPAPAAAPTR